MGLPFILVPADMTPFPIKSAGCEILADHVKVVELRSRWNSRAVKEGLTKSGQTVTRQFN
jgi:hypothetical protein